MPNKTRCEQRSGGLTTTLVFSHPAPALSRPRGRRALGWLHPCAHGAFSVSVAEVPDMNSVSLVNCFGIAGQTQFVSRRVEGFTNVKGFQIHPVLLDDPRFEVGP